MSKKLGILATVCFALALCFALVGCGSNVDKSLYTGDWTLESGSGENLDEASIELMKSLGLDVTLTLKEDGTGTIDLFGQSQEVKWEASSNSEGKLKLVEQNSETTIKLNDGKLTLADSDDSYMTFKKK